MSRPGAIPEVPGLPRESFTAWAAEQLPGLGTDWRADVVSGGLSNLTYRVTGPDRTVVVRRPPLGKLLESAHDMGREHRVLSALWGTAVPVPQVLAASADPEVLGAPFYVMAWVDGAVYREPSQTATLTVAQRRQLTAALVDVLAAIHAVDVDHVGLQDFGRPSGYLERQVRRWARQWDASRTRDLPAMTDLVRALDEQRPADTEVTLVHGDFRLDNTIVATDAPGQSDGPGPSVAAVVDWELSTLGDPLADLATWLTYYSGPGEDGSAVPVAAGLTAHDGFATTDELVQQYAEATGRDVSALEFYRAFSDFRLAVILEGVHARYLAGRSVGEGYDRVGPSVPLLVQRALARLH